MESRSLTPQVERILGFPISIQVLALYSATIRSRDKSMSRSRRRRRIKSPQGKPRSKSLRVLQLMFRIRQLNPRQRPARRSQIRALNSDIAFMQREEDKVANSNNSSHGGYFDKIAAERDQVAQLQHELSQ